MLKARLKQERTDGPLSLFAGLGLHPTAWSLLSLVPALAGLFFLILHNLAAGLAFFIISGFMDMIDGSVARATNKSTKTGAFIDGILDRYVELLLSIGLMAYLGQSTYLGLSIQFWIILLVFGSGMTSFVRAYADHRELVQDQILLKKMGGLLERAERLMLLYAGMLLGIYNQSWLEAIIVLTAILSNATVVQRIIFAIKNGEKT